MRMLKRIYKFLTPYWIIMVFGIICSLLYAIFNAASLWVVGSLISTIMGVDNTASYNENAVAFIDKIENSFNQYIFNLSEIEQLKVVCLCLIITFFLKNIFLYLNSICFSYVELKVISDIRNDLFTKVQNFSMSFFNKRKTGEILSILLNDVGAITIAFNKTLQLFLFESISMLILLYLLISINWQLTIVIVLTFPIAGYIIRKIGQSLRRKATRASFKIADLSNLVIEKLSGIKIVKAFNMKNIEIKNFSETNFKFLKLLFKQRILHSIVTPVNDMIGVTLAIVLLWYGGQQVLIYNEMSSHKFMKFIIFLFALLQPARKLGGAIAVLQSGIVGATRVFSILDLNEEKKKDKTIIDKETFNNVISIKNLFFKYNENSKNVLKNINIKINKGEKIAFVGESGSGKTTLANILLDFYEPTNGSIYLDDIDYKNLKTTTIRDIIGLVTQDPVLFNDTIKNNIQYGIKNISKISVEEAAKIANISKHINSLDEKYDTIIGENGVLLSGGQKQRISIARAVMKNSPILILDEATSSLDSISEHKVQSALDNLVQDRTVIIIAHRLSTIKNADRIFVFDNGEIIEEGSHLELLQLNGIYKKLYDKQFSDLNE